MVFRFNKIHMTVTSCFVKHYSNGLFSVYCFSRVSFQTNKLHRKIFLMDPMNSRDFTNNCKYIHFTAPGVDKNIMERKPCENMFKVTDRQLPIANVFKIMRDLIPETAKISKESKELMVKCASEFIAIITCKARNICDCEARKTITGEDLIRAMEDLDLPYYSEITKMFFDKYKSLDINGKLGRMQGESIDFSEFMN